LLQKQASSSDTRFEVLPNRGAKSPTPAMMRQIPLKNTSNTLPELGFITSAYVLRFQLCTLTAG
jgi:hypothetical protein